MNIMINGKWINLDNVARIQPTNDGSQLVIEFTSHPQESDALLFMDMTAPGVKSAWAWLQKAAIVFDETTDAELEPENVAPICVPGDWVIAEIGGVATQVRITKVLEDRYQAIVNSHEVDLFYQDIIDLAPRTKSLRTESAEKIYKVGDVIQFDTGHDIRTDTIEKVHTPDQSYEVQSYGFLVLQSDIIGLAPPESADHE